MLEHITMNVSDFEKAKEFYKEVLATIGYTLTNDLEEEKNAGYGTDAAHTDFWISAQHGAKQGIHVAFTVESKEMVDAFYAKGLELGGKDNGAPGYATEYGPDYYAAYFLDVDGNNMEATFHDPEKQ